MAALTALFMFIAVLIPLGLFVYVLCQSIFCLGLSSEMWQRARALSGEKATALRLTAISLFEPLINLFLGPLLFFTSGAPQGLPRFMLAMLPMAVLLLPATGLLLQDRDARGLARDTFLNGMARWALTACIYGFTFGNNGGFALLCFIVGIWLIRHTVISARATLATSTWMVPFSTRYATSSAPAPVLPAPTALVPPPAPAPPAPIGPPTPCPVCRATTGLYENACHSCGLVFASRIPQSLQSLPRYHAIRPLGDGGMSSVYLARVGRSDVLCVLKSLASVDGPTDAAWREQAARCLEHEAELLSQVEHPRVARLLDRVGTPLNALVLEYIPGPTLADRIAAARPQPQEVVQWGAQLADVLGELAALPEPLLHLDIKPTNLILPLDRPGPVLVDFGGAMLASQLETAQGQNLFGTPGYAAPEQYRGRAVPKSDVYGLAATLYAALTADDPADHPMVFPLLHTLEPRLAALLQTAFAYDPADRPTASAFAAALRALP